MNPQKLHHEILPCAAVTAGQRGAMYALFERCYDCVSRERFDADLNQKQFVVLLLNAEKEVKGFSTQQVITHEHDGEMLNVLFSGDTVIDPECWGTQELARGWCAVAARILRREPERRLFWLLISKGFRTYLYLPLFFRTYWPCHACNAAPWIPMLARSIAERQFGNGYDATSGLIRFPNPCGQLKPDLADIPVGRSDDPHVRFFLEHNPGYADGDEMVCLAEVSLENTAGVGHRWLNRALTS